MSKKIFSPACERNKEPICAILREYVESGDRLLEIASGSGQHAIHMMTNISGLYWQPSDASEEALESIVAYRDSVDLADLAPPIFLSTTDNELWNLPQFNRILCCNMIHIAPWEACLGLMRQASNLLPTGGSLFLYGPFLEPDLPTATSNKAFDIDLKRRNPEWGIRDIVAVTDAARNHNLTFRNKHYMPANNVFIVFEKV